MTEPNPMIKAAQDWYRKGTEALQKENFPYAAECFGSAVKMQPDTALYRQTRHGSIERMYNNNGSGARMASVRLVKVRGRIKKARLQKDWKAVDLAAEDGLLLNPWDAQLYADLAEAAQQRGALDVARHGWHKAVKLDPENMTYNREFGLLLRERREYEEARRCFERIYKAEPTNAEARSMMQTIDAESVMDQGGYEDAEKSEDVAVAPKQTVNAYEEDRKGRGGGGSTTAAPGESEETDLRHAIRKEPENQNHYVKLAELLRTGRQLPQALEVYDQALEKFGHKTDLQEAREDVELDLLRDKLSETEELLRRHPDKTRLQEKVQKQKRQLVQREIEVLEPRVENYAQDMQLKFELAERYRRTKQHQKAIPLYQQASANTRLKDDALVWLGMCFVQVRKLDLARRQFEKALDNINAADRPDPFKMAHYWLGRIYEKAGRDTDAENHYNEVLAVDFTYRDTENRLNELRGGEDALAFGDDEGLDD